MKQEAHPEFTRLASLFRELQLTGGIQIRIERPKDNAESAVLAFGPSQDPEIAAKTLEVRQILGLRPNAREIRVYYGGYSGKDDEIDIMTRSMLQIMLELAASVQVPEADVAEGRATPGAVDALGAQAPDSSMIGILSGETAPSDAYVAIPYRGRWFWVVDTDIRSKTAFAFVMLLFSISDTGVKGTAPIVTVPASPRAGRHGRVAASGVQSARMRPSGLNSLPPPAFLIRPGFNAATNATWSNAFWSA